ncbi:MAG: hypothetical protein GTO53_04580 [Planctomycetales bacterium]|nr:hypothetical protein [Planctomycetales bacterium]NIM08433.1 hypothetical protein [Planctomycetales bacterium]NIN07909.1 hypothetical protein [Planctomycetales bacterium]NIN77039.1 hypothetical protein [Planctomycetales bacterium]NIO34221.1 hypothetical protein [Planctomycetales bacterium]
MLRPTTSILAFLALFLWGVAGGVLAQPAATPGDQIPPLELPKPDVDNGGMGDLSDEIPDLGDAPSEQLPDQLEEEAGAGDGLQSVLDEADPERLFDGYGSEQEHGDEILVDYLAPIYSSGEWLNCGRWLANLDFILLWRSIGQETLLGEDAVQDATGAITARRPLSTANVGFRITPGGRFRLGKFLMRDVYNRDVITEIEYFGIVDFQVGTQLAGIGNLGILTAFDPFFSPGTLFIPTIGGFNNATFQRFEYSSDLNSFEINTRLQHRLGRDRLVAMPDGTWSRQLASGLVTAYFAGLRYIKERENLTWTSRASGVPLDVFRGDYMIDTVNELVGLQIGGDGRLQYKNFNATLRTKAGAYVNFGDSQRFILSNDPTPGRVVFNPPLRTKQQDEVLAVSIEASLRGAYHFNPNLTFRLGGDVMLLHGLALAPEQLTFEPSRGRIDLNGNVLFAGVTAGIELIW